ncbi:MAG: hypothetical protein ACI9OJ_002497 [Myxococcota bacterium]|jgi:hypothetical protein
MLTTPKIPHRRPSHTEKSAPGSNRSCDHGSYAPNRLLSAAFHWILGRHLVIDAVGGRPSGSYRPEIPHLSTGDPEKMAKAQTPHVIIVLIRPPGGALGFLCSEPGRAGAFGGSRAAVEACRWQGGAGAGQFGRTGALWATNVRDALRQPDGIVNRICLFALYAYALGATCLVCWNNEDDACIN